MIILGIDPGTATTGFGLIKRKNRDIFEVVDFGVITTPTHISDSKRLVILAKDLENIIKKYQPLIAGVEKLFFTTNQKTVMSVSQARGVILYTCARHKLDVVEFTPLQVKSRVCGYGKADKQQVQFMVKKSLGLSTTPKPDDAADALAIALCAGLAPEK